MGTGSRASGRRRMAGKRKAHSEERSGIAADRCSAAAVTARGVSGTSSAALEDLARGFGRRTDCFAGGGAGRAGQTADSGGAAGEVGGPAGSVAPGAGGGEPDAADVAAGAEAAGTGAAVAGAAGTGAAGVGVGVVLAPALAQDPPLRPNKPPHRAPGPVSRTRRRRRRSRCLLLYTRRRRAACESFRGCFGTSAT